MQSVRHKNGEMIVVMQYDDELYTVADGCVILKTSGADYKNDIMIYFERYFYGAVKVRNE